MNNVIKYFSRHFVKLCYVSTISERAPVFQQGIKTPFFVILKRNYRDIREERVFAYMMPYLGRYLNDVYTGWRRGYSKL